jgi:hypothetical protein
MPSSEPDLSICFMMSFEILALHFNAANLSIFFFCDLGHWCHV